MSKIYDQLRRCREQRYAAAVMVALRTCLHHILLQARFLAATRSKMKLHLAQLRPLSSPEAGTQAQDPAPTSPRNTGAPRRRAGMGSRLWAWLTGQKRPREEEQEEQEEGQGQ